MSKCANHALKDKIFFVQKQEIPIYIEKLEMDISKTLEKKENFPMKRGRGRPRKFPLEGHHQFNNKINKIDHYFKNGIKDENEIMPSPRKNFIVEDTRISDNSYKQSYRGDDENDSESLNNSRLSENNIRNFFNEEDEVFHANLNYDKPSKIIDFNEINGVICFYVVWEMRSNGIFPKNSYVKNHHFKEKFPKFCSDFLNKFNFD